MDPGLSQPPTASFSQQESGPGSPTVLVVDDEEVVRNVAEVMLKGLGCQVLSASSGREALDLAARVALVLLDLDMPQMDGRQTLDELRRLNPTIKAVLATGCDHRDALQRFRGQPLDGFIQKPYTMKDLKETLGSVLGG